MKSEPNVYGIDDLANDKRDWWDGVRNYQARNFMKNDMKKNDGVLFYHSSCKAPGVYGVARVSAAACPDPEQFKPDSDYYDPKATKAAPRWFCVQVAFVRKFKKPFLLPQLRTHPELRNMIILRRGNRLSITPVSIAEWHVISEEPENSA